MPSRAAILHWTVVTLLAVAVLVAHSAAMSVGETPMRWTDLLVSRSVLYAMTAIVVMSLVGWVDLQRVYRWRGLYNPFPWAMLVALALCAIVLLPGMGATINGSRRWLVLGTGESSLTFQPSELAKWLLVPTLAWWATRRAGAMRRFFDGLMPALLLVGLVCGLIVVEDLGTAVLIAAVACGLLVAAGARVWQLLVVSPMAVAPLIAATVTSDYRRQRIATFLHPYEDPQGAGYQPIQMMAAISEGGRGWGEGLIKQGYLPADTTDAVFAVICEELGIAGAALVVGLFLLLLWTALGVVRDSHWVFGRLVALGVILMIGLQTLINLAVVTVVVPTKGIALPFVSSGGTGWLVSAAAVGMVIAIDRANRSGAPDALPNETRGDGRNPSTLSAPRASAPADRPPSISASLYPP